MHTQQRNVRRRYRHLFLDQSTLLKRASGLLMLGYNIDSFDDHFVVLRVHARDVTLFASVTAFCNHNVIVSMESHLKHLRGQGHNPHKVTVTEFSGDRAEDARSPGHLVLVNDDGGVIVKFYMGAVGPAMGLGRSHDNCPDNLALSDSRRRGRFLDRGHDDVAQPCVLFAASARHADATYDFRARVVGNSES